jgi:hypothetical protein
LQETGTEVTLGPSILNLETKTTTHGRSDVAIIMATLMSHCMLPTEHGNFQFAVFQDALKRDKLAIAIVAGQAIRPALVCVEAVVPRGVPRPNSLPLSAQPHRAAGTFTLFQTRVRVAAIQVRYRKRLKGGCMFLLGGCVFFARRVRVFARRVRVFDSSDWSTET